MKIAVVHEWLTNYAGSERVVEQILTLYPDADLFSLVDFLSPSEREFILNKEVHTSFLQNLPWARKRFRAYLPLMPLAVEQFDLSAYDLVISSSHAVAKGVITGPNQLHISYVHSPIRYAWDLQHQYLQESNLGRLRDAFARLILHYIRMWDVRTAHGVDHFVCNSSFIAKRIQKTYRRKASVIYPPVNTSAFELKEEKEDFYLTASRLVPYKKLDLIVEAFAEMPQKSLVLIGDGPEMGKIMQKASPNTTIMGYQSFEVLRSHMQRAKAFVFAAEEDFGIMPVEVQACGTPVIAYGRGGALETIRPLGSSDPTGLFFDTQHPESVIQAVETFEENQSAFQALAIRQNALGFSEERFRAEFGNYVQDCIKTFWP